MNRPASQVLSQSVVHAAGLRVPRVLQQLACAAVLLAAPSAARAQDIAVYGAEIPPGFGDAIGRTFDQAGQLKDYLFFETSPAGGGYGVNANIEDIAYDAYGRVYALGKTPANALRTVFKATPGNGYMEVLFQTPETYDATVDGSIAISPTGNIAIYGARNIPGLGSSLTVYNQSGTKILETLFQTGVGTSVFSVSSTIEDIAYDAAGTLYAIGKDHLSSLRTIFKYGVNGFMNVLFQKSLPYSSAVDGSIAISPTGDISVYGAQSVSTFGTSLQTYNQAGTMIGERLFQNAVGGFSWGVSNNIEDIAYDSDGNLYAVGKPGSSLLLSVFKNAPNGMDILFQSTGNWTTTVDGSIAIAPLTAWTVDGFGVYGSDEVPELEAFGTLAAGSSNQIRLAHAVPNSIATMFIGFEELSAPFKGGILYPKATLALALATDANGMSVLPFVMPAGVPSGAELYMQCWQPDPVAFKGFAATNGLKGVTP